VLQPVIWQQFVLQQNQFVTPGWRNFLQHSLFIFFGDRDYNKPHFANPLCYLSHLNIRYHGIYRMTQAQEPMCKDTTYFTYADNNRIFHSEESHKTDKMPHILY